MKESLLIFLIYFLFSCTASVALATSADEITPCEIFGLQKFQEIKPAPDFTLRSLDGKQVSLSDFRGKPIILFFWATWCGSCRDELPEIQKFAKDRKEINVIPIVIDGEREKRAIKIIKEKKITLAVLLLVGEQGDKLMDKYEIPSSMWVPQSFIIDSRGILIGKVIGPRDWNLAWSCLKEIVK